MSSIADIVKLIPGYDPWHAPGAFTFDESRAADALGFFAEVLTFPDGPKAGTPFVLQPWQQAIVANLYGWWDGPKRRYKEAFIYVPRKNGKTPTSAGLLLHEMCCYPVDGGQYYSAAADRDQAALIFRDACRMIAHEGELAQRFKVTPSLKVIERKDGPFQMYKALSSEAGTKHGLRPMLVIVDELHAHPNPELVDTLTTGTALKDVQPLVVYITTADYQRESVCNTKYRYACRVRDGEIDDPAFLPVIYEATTADDWKSPETWKKANPNYGISVSEDFLERECKRAQHEIAYENTFKRLHLNIRTENAERIIPMEDWDACNEPVELSSLVGQTCYGGLDLSTEKDITALVLLFPETGAVLPFFWLPEKNATRRQERDGVPYKTWLDNGFLEPTDGDFVSHRHVGERIKELSRLYDIRCIAFDRAQSAGVYEEVDAYGVKMLKMPQTTTYMNGPFRELLARLGRRELHHGGHPALRWMATNVVAERDNQDRIRPSRMKSSEKIDGIVALLMAVAAESENAGQRESVYEERGLRFV